MKSIFVYTKDEKEAFELLPTRMFNADYSASRLEIAKALQQRKGTKYLSYQQRGFEMSRICQLHDDFFELRIGCKRFGFWEARKIRKWALQP